VVVELCGCKIASAGQLDQIVKCLCCLIEQPTKQKKLSCPPPRAPTAFYLPEIFKTFDGGMGGSKYVRKITNPSRWYVNRKLLVIVGACQD
jgi:hypothetical protein